MEVKGNQNCLGPDILQNVFCVLQKKDNSSTGLERQFHFWVKLYSEKHTGKNVEMLCGEGVKTIQVCKYRTHSILQNKIRLGMKYSQGLLNQIQNDNPDLKNLQLLID